MTHRDCTHSTPSAHQVPGRRTCPRFCSQTIPGARLLRRCLQGATASSDRPGATEHLHCLWEPLPPGSPPALRADAQPAFTSTFSSPAPGHFRRETPASQDHAFCTPCRWCNPAPSLSECTPGPLNTAARAPSGPRTSQTTRTPASRREPAPPSSPSSAQSLVPSLLDPLISAKPAFLREANPEPVFPRLCPTSPHAAYWSACRSACLLLGLSRGSSSPLCAA